MSETIEKNAQIASETVNAEAAASPAPAAPATAPTASFAEYLKRAVLLVNAVDAKSPTAMSVIQQVSGMLTKHPDYDASAMTEFNSAMMTAMSKIMTAASEPKTVEKPAAPVVKPAEKPAEAKKAEPAKKPAPAKKADKKQSEKSKKQEERKEAYEQRKKEWEAKLSQLKEEEAKKLDALAEKFAMTEEIKTALQEVKTVRESKGGEFKAMKMGEYVHHLADIDQLKFWEVPGKDGKSTYYKLNGAWINRAVFEYANAVKHGAERVEL